MNKDTTQEIFILFISAVIIYFTGSYVAAINDISSIFDGIVTMILFFTMFPFAIYLLMIMSKVYKSFSSLRRI
jgi:hypothetical protein